MPYEQVSISQIVKDARIAKGSFYQYFADKADLCLYLVDLFIQEKTDFFRQNPAPETSQGVFELLRWAAKNGASFELSNPKLARVSYRALFEPSPLPEEALARVREGTREFVRGLVEQGIGQGQIRAGEEEAAGFLFQAVALNLGTYIVDQLGVELENLVDGSRSLMDTQAAQGIFNDVISILERGMPGGTHE